MKTLNDPLLAYRDETFLDTEEARPIRILSEYLAPLQAFRQERIHDTVVFFGSARVHEDALGHYYGDARVLSRLITEWSRTKRFPRLSPSQGPQRRNHEETATRAQSDQQLSSN